jgi:hypothetical protein
MKNMKIVREEREKVETDSLASAMPATYPYGLCVHIDPIVYKKLDLMKAPQVGQIMALHAVVEVAGVNMENSQTGSKDISLRLQITDMELLEREKKKDPEKVIYNQEG